jgi:hypothetical protein
MEVDRVPCGAAFQAPLGLIFTPRCAIPHASMVHAMLYSLTLPPRLGLNQKYLLFPARRLQPHPANTLRPPNHGVTPDLGSGLGPSAPIKIRS